MPEEERTPDWTGEDESKTPPPGLHVLIVRITSVTFGESGRKGSPRMEFKSEVIEGEFAGKHVPFDVYFSQRAERMARYFLKKFGYPEEELKKNKPKLSSALLVGLQGKILIEISAGFDGFLKFDSKGYAHWPPKNDDGDLEKTRDRMLRKIEADLSAEDDVPEINLSDEEVMPIEADAATATAKPTVAVEGVAHPQQVNAGILDFLDDLPLCNHGPQAMIEAQDGSTFCVVCKGSGPWDKAPMQ